MNATSNKIYIPSSMPDEAWTIKDIIGEQFEFDLLFAICDALRLDGDGDIFWVLRGEVFYNTSIKRHDEPQ
jgi:hypothetical protein